MDADLPNKVLIVDDDSHVTNAIGKILEKKRIKYATAPSGTTALDKITSAEIPYALIIADQRMGDMKGTELLEQAKKICPDTQRFLLTAYSDIDVIINAVNHGSIQRYIQKPWNVKTLIPAIRAGLQQFGLSLENDKLLTLAKKQNAKLYTLNCELMEATTGRNNELLALEQEIETIQTRISELEDAGSITLPLVLESIENELSQDDEAGPERIEFVLSETILELYNRFTELAHQNGFEMPAMEGSARW